MAPDEYNQPVVSATMLVLGTLALNYVQEVTNYPFGRQNSTLISIGGAVAFTVVEAKYS